MNECSCSPTVSARIDAIFAKLPASSVDVLAQRTGIPRKDVENALSHLRQHSIEHGWTVPHAKRGQDQGTDRFFAMLVDRDGTYIDANTRGAIQAGGRGTLVEAGLKLRNMALGLRATAQHERDRRHKRAILGVAEDAEYFARKADAVALDLVEV